MNWLFRSADFRQIIGVLSHSFKVSNLNYYDLEIMLIFHCFRFELNKGIVTIFLGFGHCCSQVDLHWSRFPKNKPAVLGKRLNIDVLLFEPKLDLPYYFVGYNFEKTIISIKNKDFSLRWTRAIFLTRLKAPISSGRSKHKFKIKLCRSIYYLTSLSKRFLKMLSTNELLVKYENIKRNMKTNVIN